jgi:hypothetical protein
VTLAVRDFAHLVTQFSFCFSSFSSAFLRFGTHFGAKLASDQAVPFPGSRIILNNATWGDDVNSWARRPAAQVWDLCYSSLTDNHDNTTAFHTQCDPHSITVVFARNSIGNVFGGYVRFRLFLMRFSALCLFSVSFSASFSRLLLTFAIIEL